MGYLTFSELGGAAAAKASVAAAPVVPQADPVPATTGLSALEWSVVAIARGERLSSLKRPGRIALAMGTLFGARPRMPLADPRLEALRRLSVLAWHRGDNLPRSEITRFLAAGFSTHQFETLLTSIGRGRLAGTRLRAA
jgi:hypothetical protein